MKKVLIYLLLGLFIAPFTILAQNARNSCGTTIESQQVLFKNMVELRNRYPIVTTPRAITYVPVWFHMVAKSDGTGRTTEANVAEMVAVGAHCHLQESRI